ncbi:hypothetical protein MET9862_03948 [Methylobacterium symbioticum]|uniref:Uncharacterized protein n=1 Tax=Methylobacterium symbioticum TaxID=2584084 RepID=A0A509EJE8_9HYPH|nr:hypothetical protein MET9862_03948 [Methylobacterium symbioticum]
MGHSARIRAGKAGRTGLPSEGRRRLQILRVSSGLRHGSGLRSVSRSGARGRLMYP